MSWSVNAIGRAAAVREKLAADFTRIQCKEPEETIKNNIAASIDLALAAYPIDAGVRVEANGTQYCPDGVNAPDKHINGASLKLEHVHLHL